MMPKGYPNPVNEGFFFKWSPELAYVLGLVATNGYLGDRTGKKRAFQVQLMLRDKGIIESVAKAIGYGGNIYQKLQTGLAKHEMFGVKFGNKVVFERLEELNITPRKTHTLQMVPVPDELFSHFFRGVFDGHGVIIESQNSRTIRIVGVSRDFQEALQQRTKELTGIELNMWINEKFETIQYILHWGSFGNIKKLYNWMYNDATKNLWIERLKLKLEEILSTWSEEKRGYSVWVGRENHTPEELRELHLENKIPLKEIARVWGIKKYITIRNLAKEWGVPCKRYGLGSRQYWNRS